jgi:cholesterol oxidase
MFQTITSFPPLFGERRQIDFPPLERIDFAAHDGQQLCLHHTSGGSRGPLIITPGTAMTALTYCVDSVPKNIVEYLVEKGFDVWLMDWRTSPILEAHRHPYTLDDVAQFDWPAAIAKVRALTGRRSVSVLAHCLSSPTFLLSLVRGYVERDSISAFVASQVALHLRFTKAGATKIRLRLDRLLPSYDMIHQRPADVRFRIGDMAASFLARIMPTSFECDNGACYRHVATFGELALHSRLNPSTHAIMGDLIPQCLAGFLKDVAIWSRRDSVLSNEDFNHLDRLRLPIHFISGSENRMFVPQSTEDSYGLLCERNGESNYQRTVYPDFGHLDCYFGKGAEETIWPDIAASLEV